jgi:hypothetical protein
VEIDHGVVIGESIIAAGIRGRVINNGLSLIFLSMFSLCACRSRRLVLSDLLVVVRADQTVVGTYPLCSGDWPQANFSNATGRLAHYDSPDGKL